MTVPIVIVIIGGIMWVLAFLGGGVAVKEVVIPKMSGWSRVFSFLLGTVLIGIGTWMSITPATFPAGVSNVTVTATETLLAQPIATGQGQTAHPALTISPFCAFVTRSQIEELEKVQDVAAAIKKAEEFAGYRQNDYKQGETIPAGVLIATDLRSSDLEQFGVIPINNQGGWGLFVTDRELQAPNDGTYWCIQE